MDSRAPATDHGGMFRTRFATAILTCAGLLVAGACGDTTSPSPSSATISPGTTTAAPPATSVVPPSTSAPVVRQVAVYFTRAGLLAAVAREMVSDDSLTGTMNLLLVGPTATEKQAGFSSAIPTGTRLNRIGSTGGVATVDLSSAYASGGGSLSMMLRVAQITYTVSQFSGIDRVRYRLDGRDLTVLGGEGLLLELPQTRQDLEDVQPKILIESPAYGATVGRRFVARGTANTFEATHRLQVLDGAGSVVFDAVVTATSGSGTRGSWEREVILPPLVGGGVTVRVFEVSAADGSPQSIVDEVVSVA